MPNPSNIEAIATLFQRLWLRDEVDMMHGKMLVVMECHAGVAKWQSGQRCQACHVPSTFSVTHD